MAEDTQRYRETVSNPRAGDTPGFGTGGGGSVGGGGGYGSVGGLLAGGGGGGRDASIMATEAANRAAGAARAQAAAQQAYIASQPATGPATRGGPAVVAAQIARRNQLINDFVRNTAIAESGGVADIKNPLSSATGLHQFTQGTWNKMIKTYRPDLLEGRTKQEVLALRTDPELSTEMAGNLARENADYLESRGLPVNEGSLYLSHFLGAGTAADVLRASPDTPISDLVGADAIKANQSILGGDRTAADVAQWASNKMFASAPAAGAAAAGYSSRATEAYGPREAYDDGTGDARYAYDKLGNPLGNKAYIYALSSYLDALSSYLDVQGQKQSYLDQYVNQTTSDDIISRNEMESAANIMRSRPYDPGGFAIPTPDEITETSVSGSAPTAAPAQQAGLLDQLFGGPQALNQRIADLEAAGMTSTYPDQSAAYAKQAYADQFAGGDVSKVKSRIVDFGQGPVVDYYVKDLGDVAGEAISGLLGGIGNLFGGSRDKAVRGPNEAYGGSAIAPGSIFGNLFSGTPRADYGPYSNLTAEQYRQQYGGRDVASLAPAAQAPVVATPQQVAQNLTAPDLARSPYLWQQYYNRLPQNYGIEMAQAPLIGPTIRGIFS